MKKLYFTLLLLFVFAPKILSQNVQLSIYSEISILTAGSGDALFETFGHSAIRVKDPLLRLDHVFNYGVFDFNQPNFYGNFVQGRLEYFLNVKPYNQFIYSYQQEKRWMKEQVLELTKEERESIFNFLINNSQPENATYLYDPYFNNCSTKLRDIIQKFLANKVQLSNAYVEEGMTMRNLMNVEMPWNTWGSFGINVALGSKLDQTIEFEDYMYLPDYLYLALKNGEKIENGLTKPLVKKEVTVFTYEERKPAYEMLNPMFVFSLLFLLTIFITIRDIKRGKNSKWLDFSLFFINGLIGAFLIFLWFFTDHKTTLNNMSVLWGFAPNLLIAFYLLGKNTPKWLQHYLKLLLLLLMTLLLVWVSGIQYFSWALIPLLAVFILRYGYLLRLLSSKE